MHRWRHTYTSTDGYKDTHRQTQLVNQSTMTVTYISTLQGKGGVKHRHLLDQHPHNIFESPQRRARNEDGELDNISRIDALADADLVGDLVLLVLDHFALVDGEQGGLTIATRGDDRLGPVGDRDRRGREDANKKAYKDDNEAGFEHV